MSAVTTNRHELTVTAAAHTVRSLRARVAELAIEAGADDATVESVRLAVNEALANVVAHAYAGGEGPVDVAVEPAAGELTVVVRDHGVGVGHAPSVRGAGFGLLIIERLALRWSVRSTPGRGTEVTMAFRIGPADCARRGQRHPSRRCLKSSWRDEGR